MSTRVRTLILGGALCSALSVPACGGATGDPLGHGNRNAGGGPAEHGTGGSGQAGNGGEAGDGSGGAATGAAPGAGGKGAVGSGGTGSAGRFGAGGRVGTGGVIGAGGSVGAGGRVVGAGGRSTETGGAGGVPSWSCRAPYAPPVVGPRKDGPANPGSTCDDLPDSVILGRYADESAKVPTGFFYEEPGEIVNWDLSAGCSTSLDATTMAARAQVGGNLDGTATTPYFYEVAVCNGDARTRYRRLRCDYYDGKRLRYEPTGGVEDLLFWAGLMWFAPNQNLGGAMLISGNIAFGNATDLAEICTTKTIYGDFGLCDTITLTSTRVRGSVDGTVELISIVDGRTIKGKCR